MDLILTNGNIWTMENLCKTVEAVAVKGGVINKTGKNDEVLSLKTENTEILDLEGKTVIPGFNDSHMHLLFFAMTLDYVNLAEAASVEEIQNRLSEYIEKGNIEKGRLVTGTGFNQNNFTDRRFPTREDLDKVSTDHPIVIHRACHHLAVANSYLMELSGVDENTAQIDGGSFYFGEDGKPNGIFAEKACSLLKEGESKDYRDIERLIECGAAHLRKLGITSIQSDDFSGRYEEVYNVYIKMAKEGRLSFRLNQQCRAAGFEAYRQMMSLPPVDEKISGFYKLGPVKIMGDGSLGARTAYMRRPYNDDPSTRGIPIYSQEEFYNIVKLAHDQNRQTAIHAIGDGAVEMAVEAIEKAQRENLKAGLRHGIVHCQITDLPLLKRIKENGIILLFQPVFLDADLHMVKDRVGESLASQSYAFKTAFDMGIPVAFGTDCPVEYADPFKNIYCAVTRKDTKGYPAEGFFPHEKMTAAEAVYCYTQGSAYAACEENIKGSIESGKVGDMVVLSRDIFSCKPEEILDTHVEITVLGGKVIYRRG